MQGEKNIIKVNETNEGKVIVHLYNQYIDITHKVKDGKANITVYGKEFEVVVNSKKKETKPAKKIKVTGKSKTEKPDIKFIKIPIKK